MYALLAVCLFQLALLAYLVYERGRLDAVRAGLEIAHATQIDGLLQRIQAPELAVMQHQLAVPVVNPPSLPFDDDDAFHKTREELAAELNIT